MRKDAYCNLQKNSYKSNIKIQLKTKNKNYNRLLQIFSYVNEAGKNETNAKGDKTTINTVILSQTTLH